jgi:uncharacterized protein
MSDAIVVFARAPVPGQVKTRLARSLGDAAAASLYAAMLRDSLFVAKQAAESSGGCKVLVAYTPENAFEEPHSLARFWSEARLPQHGDNLGQRMVNCIQHLQAQTLERVILIGSDSPDLSHTYICQAFEHLRRGRPAYGLPIYLRDVTAYWQSDLVFGPARDGGFYLFGATANVSLDFFSEIDWTSKNTLAQVKAKLDNVRLRVSYTPKWADVDTVEDLRQLAKRLRRHPKRAWQTYLWLRSQGLL